MASSTTLSPAIIPSDLCSSKNGVNSASQVALQRLSIKRMKVSCLTTSNPADDRVPDMGKRQLLGAISLPAGGILLPYTYFFVPLGISYRHMANTLSLYRC